MSWWQAIRIFTTNNNEPKYFMKMMTLLGIGVFDDVLDPIPIIDFITIGDNFVLVGFGIFAIIRIRSIHHKGNKSKVTVQW